MLYSKESFSALGLASWKFPVVEPKGLAKPSFSYMLKWTLRNFQLHRNVWSNFIETSFQNWGKSLKLTALASDSNLSVESPIALPAVFHLRYLINNAFLNIIPVTRTVISSTYAEDFWKILFF